MEVRVLLRLLAVAYGKLEPAFVIESDKI